MAAPQARKGHDVSDARASEARAEVMAGIRRALGVTGTEKPRQQAVANRLADSPRGVIPAARAIARGRAGGAVPRQGGDGGGDGDGGRDRGRGAGRHRPLLARQQPAATLRRGGDPRLAGLPWDATTLEMSVGPSDGSDVNAVSQAVGGVAETGTLALISGPDNPTSLNSCPTTTSWWWPRPTSPATSRRSSAACRAGQGGTALPRTVNLVTGPSRSADIEQTLILGAHGPRRLHIIIVDS